MRWVCAVCRSLSARTPRVQHCNTRFASPCRVSCLPALQHKDVEEWERLGGLEGVAAALATSLHDGVRTAASDGTGPDLETRR